METQRLLPSAQNIAYAAELLRKGNLAGIPTETVYGLAANALDEEAVKNIFVVKGRPQDNPLIAHIADMDMLPIVANDIPQEAYLLAEAFWPGPLTMVLPRSRNVADVVCAGLATVGVRMPSHKVAREVIRAAGVPLAMPSANLSGSPSPTTAYHVYTDLQGKIPLILDGGASEVGVESTVVSLVGKPTVLRPGFVTVQQIEEVLGRKVEVAEAVLHPLAKGEKAASPGMMYKHYAPKAEITILQGSADAYVQYVNDHAEQDVWALCFESEKERIQAPAVTYGDEDDPASQAAALFNALRLLDDKGARRVYAHAPLLDGVGLAVYNRLLRAASFRVLEV